MTRKNNRRRKQLGPTSISYDPLEKRLPLTTFVVNTAIDDVSAPADGLISLREATIAANTNAPFGDAPAGSADGDRIEFAAGIVQVELSDPLQITDDLFIQAGTTDGQRVTLSNPPGLKLHRLLEIDSAERVVLNKIHLNSGRGNAQRGHSLPDDGGAVYTTGSGTVVLKNSLLSQNRVNDRGGAIYQENGIVSLIDTEFLQNSTHDVGIESGGADIFTKSGTLIVNGGSFQKSYSGSNGGSIIIDDSQLFASNTVFKSNSAYNSEYIDQGLGGALLLQGESQASIHESEFDGNTAYRSAGAIWISELSTLIATEIEFRNNSATRWMGGAILNEGGRLSLNNITFEENGALGGRGGALSIDGGRNTIIDTIFKRNDAVFGGAIEFLNGSLFIKDSQLENNTARVEGGAIRSLSKSGSLIVKSTNIQNNTVDDRGGGISLGPLTTTRVSDSRIDDNRADGRQQGEGGGGIFMVQAKLFLSGGQVSNNIAREGGGIFSTAGKINADQTRFSSNESLGHGGGIKANSSTVTLKSAPLLSNKAGVDIDRTGLGGAVHLAGIGSRLVASGEDLEGFNSFYKHGWYSTIFRNNIADEGGAIWVGSGATMYLAKHTTFENNRATTGSAGAIFNAGHVRTQEAHFEANTSEQNGGAIHQIQGSSLQLHESTDFVENTAEKRGGAIFNAGYIQDQLSVFTDNSAVIFGDDIFNTQTGTVV